MKTKISLATAFNIREGEGRPLTLLTIHSFLMGMTLVFFNTGASAMFLDQFDSATLPYVYIGAAVVVTAIGFVYAKIEEYLSMTKLITGNLVFLVLSVACLRILLSLTDSKWPIMLIFIWLEVVTVMIGLEFWGLAGQIFNVRQGKRLFGLIGAGEVAAGILAGLSAGSIASFIGTQNLLWCSTAALAGSLGIMRYIVHSFADAFKGAQDDSDEQEKYQPLKIKEIFKNIYLRLILGLTAISVVVFYFIDFAFYDQAESRYQTAEELAAFFGFYFALSGALSLVGRGFASGRLLNRYGLSLGLLGLPAVLMLGAGAASLSGTFFASASIFFGLIVMTKLFDDVVRTSIEEPSVLILYQPLPTRQRLGVQAMVESIIEPVAIGIAGGMLLLLTKLFDFKALQAAYIIVALPVFWMVAAILLRREYTASLVKALEKRSLSGLALSLDDALSIELLKRALRSPHPGEVIYALNMLEEIEHESLANFLIAMIDHPEPFVRKDVLMRMARLCMIPACDHVAKRIDVEKVPEVKGMALKTLCILGEADVFELVFPFLNSTDPALKKGAMIGLLISGGIEGVLAAGEVLTAMINSHNSLERRLSAEILGDIGIRLFHRPLIQLLQDDDIDVKRAALTAAGKLGNPRLWPLVIENLTLSEVGQTAFAALVLGSESAVDALSESFARRDQSHKTRKRIVQILARIKSQATVRFLLENIDFPDVNIRHQILRALSACEFRADSSQKELIKSKIFSEVKETVWALGALADIGQEGEALVILARALQYEIDCAIDRIMLLVSFIYPSEAIQKAYESLKHVSPEKRAYALEAFDNLLAQDLKDVIFPLIDDIQLAQRLKHLDPLFPQKSHGKLERLSEIVARPSASASAWSQTCGLYIMGQLGHEQFAEIVTPALASSIEMVRETAVWTLGRISPDDLGERIRHLIDDSSAKVADITRSILSLTAHDR